LAFRFSTSFAISAATFALSPNRVSSAMMMTAVPISINIRVWTDPRNGGSERIATKAGIACNVRLLPELIEALQQAEVAARKAGLL
jgi:hypothetical protein